MKKLIALLLSLMLVVGCAAALAETEAATEAKPASFDVKMDKIPDGYSFEYSYSSEGWLYGIFTAVNDPEAAEVYFAICEMDEDITLTEKLSDAEVAELKILATDEYANPTIDQVATANGTIVIVVEEAEDPYYADFYTAWHGYSIQAGLLKNTPITQADKDLAMTILSDLWVIKE